MTPTVAIPLAVAFWTGPIVIWVLGRFIARHPVSTALEQTVAQAERRLRWPLLLLSLLFVAVIVHFALGGLPAAIWWVYLVGWNAGVAGYVDIVLLRKILARSPTRVQGGEPVIMPITPPAGRIDLDATAPNVKTTWTAEFWQVLFAFVVTAAVTLVFWVSSVSSWQHLTAQQKGLLLLTFAVVVFSVYRFVHLVWEPLRRLPKAWRQGREKRAQLRHRRGG